jgi:hypothetical protein
MACIAPDAGLTVEERACCRTMKSDCGQMEMPASHDCCKKTSGTIHAYALRSDIGSFHPVVAVAIWSLSHDLFRPGNETKDWIQRSEHSPPKPPPTSFSVLRV